MNVQSDVFEGEHRIATIPQRDKGVEKRSQWRRIALIRQSGTQFDRQSAQPGVQVNSLVPLSKRRGLHQPHVWRKRQKRPYLVTQCCVGRPSFGGLERERSTGFTVGGLGKAPSVRLGHASGKQAIRHHFTRHSGERQVNGARKNRRQYTACIVGKQDRHRISRRLFKCLEKCILRFRPQCMSVFNQRNMPAKK